MRKVTVIISILLILFITGCEQNPVENPVEENKTYSTFSEKVVNDVIVRNHNVAYYDNIYHVYLSIENENNTTVNYNKINIRYYKDSALIYSTIQEIGSIDAHGSIDISFNIDINLVNANKVEYTIE